MPLKKKAGFASNGSKQKQTCWNREIPVGLWNTRPAKNSTSPEVADVILCSTFHWDRSEIRCGLLTFLLAKRHTWVDARPVYAVPAI